jgi:hypothetical protein
MCARTLLTAVLLLPLFAAAGVAAGLGEDSLSMAASARAPERTLLPSLLLPAAELPAESPKLDLEELLTTDEILFRPAMMPAEVAAPVSKEIPPASPVMPAAGYSLALTLASLVLAFGLAQAKTGFAKRQPAGHRVLTY